MDASTSASSCSLGCAAVVPRPSVGDERRTRARPRPSLRSTPRCRLRCPPAGGLRRPAPPLSRSDRRRRRHRHLARRSAPCAALPHRHPVATEPLCRTQLAADRSSNRCRGHVPQGSRRRQGRRRSHRREAPPRPQRGGSHGPRGRCVASPSRQRRQAAFRAAARPRQHGSARSSGRRSRETEGSRRRGPGSGRRGRANRIRSPAEKPSARGLNGGIMRLLVGMISRLRHVRRVREGAFARWSLQGHDIKLGKVRHKMPGRSVNRAKIFTRTVVAQGKFRTSTRYGRLAARGGGDLNRRDTPSVLRFEGNAVR